MKPRAGRRPAFAPTAGLAALGLLITAAATPRALAAQEPSDTFALPGIVVTATRVPLHREALPTPVTVLTGEELRERGVRTVAEALRSVPGATVTRSGAAGAQTSLFLRGGESDYVKVLIDGVPVNDPGGFIDLADLGTDQVERIEVVRGPVSVLYGSDAVVGVVQIFTRRGRGDPKLLVNAAGGIGERRYEEESYGSFDVDATLTGSAGGLAYTLGGGRSWTAGAYPFNSERSLETGTARLGWSPRAGTELAAFARVSGSESHYPTDGAGVLADSNAYLDRRLWTAGFEAGHRLTERLEVQAQLGLSSRTQSSVDRQDAASDTLGVYASMLAWDVVRRSAGVRLTADLDAATATVGIETQWSDAEKAYASESEFGPLDADGRYERSNRGYYAQLLARPIDAVSLTIGGRLDDNESFGTFATYRLGASIRLLDGVRLRGALGRAFREPTLDESFGSGFGDLGNPALEPERSRSWEAGVEVAPSPALRLSATWFDQRFDDLIQYTFTPPETGDPNYFNVGAAAAKGLEVGVDAELGRAGLTASYSRLWTEVLDPGLATDLSFVRGEPLLRRPAQSGSVTARLPVRRGHLSVTVSSVGEREDLDFAGGYPVPRITLPAYATLDAAAAHPLPLRDGPRVDLTVRLENALNAEYQTVRGFPAPGRAVWLGVRIGTR